MANNRARQGRATTGTDRMDCSCLPMASGEACRGRATTLFLTSVFCLLSSNLFAETRVKTVEYNFGGYYSATNKASGAQTNFPTRTVKLPENGKAIRSAWLEFEGLAVSAANINPLTISFDAGTAAATARFTSGQYTSQTAESIRLFARADVTSVINAELAQLAAGRQFTAAVAITGPTSNMHTMKLYITYEYDDLSPVQVKIINVGAAHEEYCQNLASRLKAENIRLELDLANETVGNKIRKSAGEKIPYTLVIGDKEMASENLMVRIRGEEKLWQTSWNEFTAKIKNLTLNRENLL